MTPTDGLRPIVDALDREMTRLAARVGVADADTAGLLSAWARLVDFLALGPAPELRACPFCGAVGMRAATLCGTCWRRLDPPAAGAERVARDVESATPGVEGGIAGDHP